MNLSKLDDDSKFNQAMHFLLRMEGGYTADPRDLGNKGNKATNFGIIQTTYDSFRLSKQLPRRSVRDITMNEVVEIYRNRYWLPCGCDQMPAKLALVVMDIAVNMGIGKPFEYLQELIGTKEKTWNSRLKNDLNYYLSKHSEDDLVKAILERRETSYRRYASKGNQRVFLQGWLNRVAHLKNQLQELA